PRHDAAGRGEGAETRPTVDTCRVPDRQHVADVREQLAPETHGEPLRMDVVELVPDAIEPGDVAEAEGGGDGKRGGDEDDDERTALRGYEQPPEPIARAAGHGPSVPVPRYV